MPQTFVAPSGRKYRWQKDSPPTQADIDAIVAYENEIVAREKAEARRAERPRGLSGKPEPVVEPFRPGPAQIRPQVTAGAAAGAMAGATGKQPPQLPSFRAAFGSDALKSKAAAKFFDKPQAKAPIPKPPAPSPRQAIDDQLRRAFEERAVLPRQGETQEQFQVRQAIAQKAAVERPTTPQITTLQEQRSRGIQAREVPPEELEQAVFEEMIALPEDELRSLVDERRTIWERNKGNYTAFKDYEQAQAALEEKLGLRRLFDPINALRGLQLQAHKAVVRDDIPATERLVALVNTVEGVVTAASLGSKSVLFDPAIHGLKAAGRVLKPALVKALQSAGKYTSSAKVAVERAVKSMDDKNLAAFRNALERLNLTDDQLKPVVDDVVKHVEDLSAKLDDTTVKQVEGVAPTKVEGEASGAIQVKQAEVSAEEGAGRVRQEAPEGKEPWEMTREGAKVHISNALDEAETYAKTHTPPAPQWDNELKASIKKAQKQYDDARKAWDRNPMPTEFQVKRLREAEAKLKDLKERGGKAQADNRANDDFFKKKEAEYLLQKYPDMFEARNEWPFYMGSSRYSDLYYHKDTVAKALREGKSVPPEVLADYPDLATKYAKEPPVGKEPWEIRYDKGVAVGATRGDVTITKVRERSRKSSRGLEQGGEWFQVTIDGETYKSRLLGNVQAWADQRTPDLAAKYAKETPTKPEPPVGKEPWRMAANELGSQGWARGKSGVWTHPELKGRYYLGRAGWVTDQDPLSNQRGFVRVTGYDKAPLTPSGHVTWDQAVAIADSPDLAAKYAKETPPKKPPTKIQQALEGAGEERVSAYEAKAGVTHGGPINVTPADLGLETIPPGLKKPPPAIMNDIEDVGKGYVGWSKNRDKSIAAGYIRKDDSGKTELTEIGERWYRSIDGGRAVDPQSLKITQKDYGGPIAQGHWGGLPVRVNATGEWISNSHFMLRDPNPKVKLFTGEHKPVQGWRVFPKGEAIEKYGRVNKVVTYELDIDRRNIAITLFSDGTPMNARYVKIIESTHPGGTWHTFDATRPALYVDANGKVAALIMPMGKDEVTKRYIAKYGGDVRGEGLPKSAVSHLEELSVEPGVSPKPQPKEEPPVEAKEALKQDVEALRKAAKPTTGGAGSKKRGAVVDPSDTIGGIIDAARSMGVTKKVSAASEIGVSLFGNTLDRLKSLGASGREIAHDLSAIFDDAAKHTATYGFRLKETTRATFGKLYGISRSARTSLGIRGNGLDIVSKVESGKALSKSESRLWKEWVSIVKAVKANAKKFGVGVMDRVGSHPEGKQLIGTEVRWAADGKIKSGVVIATDANSITVQVGRGKDTVSLPSGLSFVREQLVDPDKFFPRVLRADVRSNLFREGSQVRSEAIGHLKKNGFANTDDEAAEIIREAFGHGVVEIHSPIASRLRRQRTGGLLPDSFYDRDFLSVAEKYIAQASMDIAAAKRWGKDYTLLTEKLAALPHGAKEAKDLIDSAISPRSLFDTQAHRFASAEGMYQAITKLTLPTTAFLQVTQTASTLGIMGARAFMKSAALLAKDLVTGREIIDTIKLSGVIDQDWLSLLGFADLRGVARDITGMATTPMRWTDRMSRVHAALAGAIHAQDMVGKVKVKNGAISNNAAYRWLEDWAEFTNADIIRMKETGMSADDVVRAMSAGTKTQVRTRAIDLAPVMNTPLGRIYMRFKTFMYGQARNVGWAVKEARKGNAVPLARLVIAGTVAGVGVEGFRDFWGKTREGIHNAVSERDVRELAGAWSRTELPEAKKLWSEIQDGFTGDDAKGVAKYVLDKLLDAGTLGGYGLLIEHTDPKAKWKKPLEPVSARLPQNIVDAIIVGMKSKSKNEKEFVDAMKTAGVELSKKEVLWVKEVYKMIDKGGAAKGIWTKFNERR